MKEITKYNIYIFINTFIRNIIDAYSIVYLMKLNYTLKEIILIYDIIYFLGIFITKYSLKLGNKIGLKKILLISNIITTIIFLLIKKINNIYLIAILLSLSIYTYHPIRHYYSISILKNKKDISNNIIIIYIGILLSNYLVIKNNNLIIIILLIISIISLKILPNINKNKIKTKTKLPLSTIKIYTLDQFRILFILLEPLYLYKISNTIKYIGKNNIILTISSIVLIYIISKTKNINKTYFIINIIFTLTLILKINIIEKNILLILAIFEGIGIKINEIMSTINIYNTKNKTLNHIIASEQYFCYIRSIILSIIYILNISLKNILYIFIIGIFILSFIYKKEYKL